MSNSGGKAWSNRQCNDYNVSITSDGYEEENKTKFDKCRLTCLEEVEHRLQLHYILFRLVIAVIISLNFKRY